MLHFYFVYIFVDFCLQSFHSVFKSILYLNNRKVADAVRRSFPIVNPLFYLSSFLFPFAETPLLLLAAGVFLLYKEIPNRMVGDF